MSALCPRCATQVSETARRVRIGFVACPTCGDLVRMTDSTSAPGTPAPSAATPLEKPTEIVWEESVDGESFHVAYSPTRSSVLTWRMRVAAMCLYVIAPITLLLLSPSGLWTLMALATGVSIPCWVAGVLLERALLRRTSTAIIACERGKLRVRWKKSWLSNYTSTGKVTAFEPVRHVHPADFYLAARFEDLSALPLPLGFVSADDLAFAVARLNELLEETRAAAPVVSYRVSSIAARPITDECDAAPEGDRNDDSTESRRGPR